MTDLDDTLDHEVGIAATDAARPRPWHEIHERGRRVRRRRHAAAAVGAVAVVATVAAVAGPLTDTGGGRPIGPAGQVAHVVPWKPMPPTRAQIPRSVTPARPDPALARNAKSCVPSDLNLDSRLDGAGGRWILDLVVRTTSTRPCRVQGHPVLSFVRGGSPAQVPQEPATGSANSYREAVLLDAEHEASVEVAWSTTGCPQGSEPARPALALPGRTGWAVAQAVKASPLCTSGEVSSQPVAVGPFRPTRYTPARARSAYAAVRARITDAHPDAGARRVSFRVSLTTRRSTALVPCPDYTVVVAGRAGSVERRYALNCAAVPYLDGERHAYLPAHKSVTFAMQVPLTPALAEEADLKLVWALQVPENVGDAVSVDARG